MAMKRRSLLDQHRLTEREEKSLQILELLRQRVYALALGDADLNDRQALRHDMALQTALDTDSVLALAPTLCRFEHWAVGLSARVIHEEMVEAFIRSTCKRNFG